MAIYHIFFALKFTDYLIFIVLSVLTYVSQYYYKYFTRPNKLPGPLPLPFIECGYLFTGNNKKLLTSLHKKYGDIFEIYIRGMRRIVISRPEYLEKIFNSSSNDTTFIQRFPYLEGLDELGWLGKGLKANHNIKSWRFNRQFFDQAILSPSFNYEAVEWINNLVQELEGYWKSLANLNLSQDDKNEWSLEIDIAKWIHRFTCDMVSIVITGERCYSMTSYYNIHSTLKVTRSDTVIEDSERFIQGINEFFLKAIYFTYLGPFLRNNLPFIKDKVKTLLGYMDFMFETLDKIIKKRRREIEEMPIGAKLRSDMLTSLIVTNTERDMNSVKISKDNIFRPMTDIEIRGNLLDAFLGGVNSTANAFTAIVYYVCRSPEIKQKMLAEIDSIFPPNNSLHLKYDDLLKLEYCTAVLYESARISPNTIEQVRYVETPCEIAGHQCEAKTMIIINVNGIHRHKDHWPNPGIFDPDRFYKKERHKCSLVTFGGGLRICPGRKLSLTELLSLMVIVFGKYDVELVDKGAPLEVESGGLNIHKGLPIRIKPRK
ncbi:cytochrome P450 [Gigaspora rosea]|uniref:Cytochrome P450 n=1 Tax=Gigaspora rosea TaxID=44941 RepID=A0A397UCK0_9GLOM|nr:cytochrome P450 [Gigaspora rosea]